MERDPHRFLEGVLIAATVVGIKNATFICEMNISGCRELLDKSIHEMMKKILNLIYHTSNYGEEPARIFVEKSRR